MKAAPPQDSYELNISEMFPEVTNVTALFYYQGSTSNSTYRQAISPQCFSKCINCDDLFNSAWVTIPLNCDFTAAESMRFAFAYAYSTSYVGANTSKYNRGLINIQIGTKADISGMFAASSDATAYSEVSDNLQTLLGLKNQTTGAYTGMLYGYDNDLTKDEYKSVRVNRELRVWMHA